MKRRKIRGHNRRHRYIEGWVKKNLELNVDILNKHKVEITEIIVHPWCDISLSTSIIPEPSRKTRLLMLKGLFAIYQSWKIKLEKLGKPYYLKIWIYEPRFSKSQVVCAVDDEIEYYNTLFDKIDDRSSFENKIKLPGVSWELALDEDVYAASEFGLGPEKYFNRQHWLYDQRLWNRLKSGKYETSTIENGGETDTLYFVPQGYVWLGEVK